jgi:tight adherence protein C
MLELLAAIVTGLATTTALVVLLRRPRPDIDARIAQFRRQLTRTGGVRAEEATVARARDGAGAAALLPPPLRARLSRALTGAGSTLSVHRFVSATLVLQAVGALAGITVGSNVAHPAAPLLGLAGGLSLGTVPPLLWLRGIARRRRAAIWRSLPDASDLLTACVEAGMSIDAAFARVADDMHGPLSDEIRTMLREIALGRPRQLALADVGARSGVPDLDAMIAAISQADESGTSLAAVLRAQARHLRVQRRLFAEERARKVPAKMTFPIIFFIVPTLFVLVLGPLGLELLETFQQ